MKNTDNMRNKTKYMSLCANRELMINSVLMITNSEDKKLIFWFDVTILVIRYVIHTIKIPRNDENMRDTTMIEYDPRPSASNIFPKNN